MTEFLKKEIDGEKLELIIDTNLFPKDIILKSAYNFLDKGYFFFKFNEDNNIVLQFSPKNDVKIKPEQLIGDYYDELLSVYLRDKLEKDNKVIRETIITAAISNSLDRRNFVSLDTDNQENNSQIDFDKDIDEIIREIENDPDLQINQEEIERILKEIESECGDDNNASSNDKIVLDPKNAKNAKKRFQDGE